MYVFSALMLVTIIALIFQPFKKNAEKTVTKHGFSERKEINEEILKMSDSILFEYYINIAKLDPEKVWSELIVESRSDQTFDDFKTSLKLDYKIIGLIRRNVFEELDRQNQVKTNPINT